MTVRPRMDWRGSGVASGFTLVELLVGMVLLSVIVLALGSALRTFAQTEIRVDQRIVRDDDFRATVAFLRTVLGRVSTQKIALVAGESPRPLFRTSPGGLEWLGVMPARHGMGGLHYFRLGIESDGRTSALVFRFQPFVGRDIPPDWDAAAARVLVPEVGSFSLRYRDGLPAEPVWADVWTEPSRLPDRLVLSLASAGETWPELVIPLRRLTGGRSGGAAFGGTIE